jgi:hypothetical protein
MRYVPEAVWNIQFFELFPVQNFVCQHLDEFFGIAKLLDLFPGTRFAKPIVFPYFYNGFFVGVGADTTITIAVEFTNRL